MNHSARKQHHEQARKKHRHEQQEHARELAEKKRSNVAVWILGVGILLMIALVIVSVAL